MLSPTEKALLLRKSKYIVSPIPWKAYANRLNAPKKILSIIEENSNEKN